MREINHLQAWIAEFVELYKYYFEVCICTVVGEKTAAEQVDGKNNEREYFMYLGNQIRYLYSVIFQINHSFVFIKQILCLINLVPVI